MKNKIERLCLGAVLAALIFAGTCLRIPLPVGYAHLGDCAALFAASFFPAPVAYPAVMLGAALADLLGGYALYLPATLAIKAASVLCVQGAKQKGGTKAARPSLQRFAVSMAGAEGIMILGYFLFDALLYALPAALSALSGNALQGAVGCLGALLLYAAFRRTGALKTR